MSEPAYAVIRIPRDPDKALAAVEHLEALCATIKTYATKEEYAPGDKAVLIQAYVKKTNETINPVGPRPKYK